VKEILVSASSGVIGNTTYLQAFLSGAQVATTIHAAMDFPEFESFMASEKMQRELSEQRVEREIVPYLCLSADRFFGSLIVLVYQPELFDFKSWSELGLMHPDESLNALSSSSGVLRIRGGKLFALDGQHRLHAIRTVVSSASVTPRLGQPITGEFRNAVADDQFSVLFVPFDSNQKARRIFNKVNRYAKATSTATNLLTSEDDGYAIVTRCLLGIDKHEELGATSNPPLKLADSRGNHLVAFEESGLSTGSGYVTTLNAVNECVKLICGATGQMDLDERRQIVRPPNDALAAAYEECVRWFDQVLSIPEFAKYIANPDTIPGARHMSEPCSLLLRPKGLEVFFGGLVDAHLQRVSLKTLIRRAGEMPLSLADDPWIGVLVGTNGKMKIKNAKLARRIVTWLLAGKAIGAAKRAKVASSYALAIEDAGMTPRPLLSPID
jgi:DNA sulfur modification protein DndB